MVTEFLHWLGIVTISLFGAVCVFFLVRYMISVISPEVDEKIELYFILKDIRRYLSFLFEKGYKIRNAHYSPNPNGNWVVKLQSQDCVISIVQDRSEILVSFSPVFGADNPHDQFSLESLIYFLSGGQIFIGTFEGNLAWGKKKQFERLEGLLRNYIDQIAPLFGSSYREHLDELRDAQNNYSGIVWSRITGNKQVKSA